jgi:hypothetical protein
MFEKRIQARVLSVSDRAELQVESGASGQSCD